MSTGDWASVAEIKARVEKVWRRGEILRAPLTGEAPFPLEIRLKGPSPRDIADRFGDVQDWVAELVAAQKTRGGYGFDLLWGTARNRVQGTNKVPLAAVIPTEADALRLIERRKEAELFRQLAEMTLRRHPALRPWLVRRPLALLEHAETWDRLLAVLDYFVDNPRPGVYARQIDVPGVDTKFIEQNRRLLADLLDLVLPEVAVNRTATGVRGFNRRYGLRDEPPLVRFRLLDESLYLSGLNDLSLPPEQFAALRLPIRRVFVTENRTNGLAFPDCPDSMVVFGLGYGLDRLSEATWLQEVAVYYWGDIDSHGFVILNRLRATLPHAQSLLMDRETLLAHRDLWGQEPQENRYSGDVLRLMPEERDLLQDLLCDRLGTRVRLEQERIGYGWLRQALDRLLAA